MATPAAAAQPKAALPMSMRSAYSGAPISGLRKAAILMVALGDDLAKVLFQSLSQADVERVTDEITRLGNVPTEQSTHVLSEFYGLFETERYVVRGGVEYARRLLTEAFGAERAQSLLIDVQKMRERTHGDLAMLQELDPQQLSKFLANEHPQTVALVLAHLDAKRGSTVLMMLDSTMRVQCVQRLAEMRQFSPEMAQKVGTILHRQMEALGSNGRRSYAGFKAVADLLNRLATDSSKQILEAIEKDQPKLAIGIRNLMFAFEDLMTVPEASIRELVGAADKKVLAMALKGTGDNLKAHILRAMSTRASEMLNDDMESLGTVRNKDVAQAQQELLVLARALEAEGKMTLKAEAEDELSV